MSLLRRLVNVAWFRARQTLDGEPGDARAAALDEELARAAPAPAAPPVPAPPPAEAEAPRAPKPRRL
jgi:hypothetical protein